MSVNFQCLGYMNVCIKSSTMTRLLKLLLLIVLFRHAIRQHSVENECLLLHILTGGVTVTGNSYFMQVYYVTVACTFS
jgi:hypothetical protein